MHGCWVAFAKTGVPACPAAPTWPAYKAADDKIMRFTAKPEVVANPSARTIDLLLAKAVDR